MKRTARFVATHSILTLDARHPFVAKSLMDAHEMHRTVMSGFYGWVEEGSSDPRAQMGILSTWAVDLKNASLVLVVQSKVPGDWSGIPHAALLDKPQILTVDRTFTTGDTVGFRTVVNATRTIPAPGPPGARPRGRRAGHTTPAHVKTWFMNRLGSAPADPKLWIGATSSPDAISARMLPAASSPSPHKNLRITRAELRGTLTITSPEAFVSTLTTGLGHARAYSCGLLLAR
ncbi:type I-E CRISPR-associated protein Cas6/Cse3/CasE [Actinocorallia lasiicapitis]